MVNLIFLGLFAALFFLVLLRSILRSAATIGGAFKRRP